MTLADHDRPDAPALIPAPRTLRHLPGAFRLDARTTLDAGPGTEDTARWLRATLGAATGYALAPGVEGSAAEGSVIRLRVAPEDAGPADAPGQQPDSPERYRLHADADGITLNGAAPAGVFRGAQTLRQLLGTEAFRRAPLDPGRQWTVPGVLVEDAPRFGWRGMMLDVSRHFMPKDGVLRYLDLLAAHKLNVFHFHLTDDQGWRIEIKRYPRLTEVGSWRSRTKYGHRASPLWEDKPHGGHYTQDDIREIVAYARERHIRVVPEIDIPGHSQAAISAYPELGNADAMDTTTLSVWDTWGINPNVLAPTDNTLRFYEGVLEEVLDLFPADIAPFVHIGGDECPRDQWKQSAAAQQRIRELGLADEGELQAWFTRHFGEWLTARGRRLIGWDEILDGSILGGDPREADAAGPVSAPAAQGSLPPGTAVSSWRGYAGGIAAARAGHDVVMCPEQQVYLDHRQHGGADEPVPIGYVRTLEDVYRFEPLPPELTPAEAAHVLGTQANVWTEVMESAARVDYQVFPRLVALSEVAWSALPAPAERDFAGFEARMASHYGRLDALGVDYRPPSGPLPRQQRPGVLGRPIEGAPPNV